MSGGYNYADAYSRYQHGNATDADYSKYVDAKHGNYWKLLDAYNKGEDVDKKFSGKYKHPAGLSPSQQAEYWVKRGANTKAAFGRAHAAEDAALRSGTYRGGTDVSPYEGKTTFEKWLQNRAGDSEEENGPDGPIDHDNPYFPMLVQDYAAPAAQDWSEYMGGNKGLLFQPWTSDYQKAAGIPNNLWNYSPPEGIDYAVRYNNPLTGKLNMDLMPAGDSKTGGDTTGVKPGSDQARDLAAGRTHHPEMYDADGNWIGAGGDDVRSRDFAAEAHEAMYPGAQRMAANSGFGLLTANRFNPAYRDYRQNNINQMISMGVLPAGSTSYKSQNWRDWMDVLGGRGGDRDESESATDAADIEATAGGGHGVVG